MTRTLDRESTHDWILHSIAFWKDSMTFLAMASEESRMASLSSTLRVRLSMLPGVVVLVLVLLVPLGLFRDREGHVKQKVSRREHPLLMDVTLCVGVILPETAAADDDDDDDSVVIVVSSVGLSLSPLPSVWIGEEHDKLMRSFASRRTSLLLTMLRSWFRTIDPNLYANPINAHSSLEGGEGIAEDELLLLLLLLLEPIEVARDQPGAFGERITTFLFIYFSESKLVALLIILIYQYLVDVLCLDWLNKKMWFNNFCVFFTMCVFVFCLCFSPQ